MSTLTEAERLTSPILLCVVGPAGVGKNTLVEKMIAARSKLIIRSISSTTRRPRANEVNGREYHFLSDAEFRAKINQQEFFEWEDNHGQLYGTSKDAVEVVIRQASSLVLVIDIRGAASVKAKYPQQTSTVFIAPPSFSVLEERIRRRGGEDEKQIQVRLESARRELKALAKELKQPQVVDYLIFNQDFDSALKSLIEIFDVERMKLKNISKNLKIDIG